MAYKGLTDGEMKLAIGHAFRTHKPGDIEKVSDKCWHIHEDSSRTHNGKKIDAKVCVLPGNKVSLEGDFIDINEDDLKDQLTDPEMHAYEKLIVKNPASGGARRRGTKRRGTKRSKRRGTKRSKRRGTKRSSRR
jgi:hypothetical protein